MNDAKHKCAAFGTALDYDIIIIGAGISGMYQLHTLRKEGYHVKVFEAGTGVGGTWYWNRYPGARFDSESYSYGYSFSQALLQEWDWKEHFSPQPETERYLNYVADKFDLRRDIQFSCRVEAAHFDNVLNIWTVTLESGRQFSSRFLVTAVGPLSAPTWPRFEGMEKFKGQAYHTGLWPKEPVDFNDKRVAVIGTGATGVQTIQEVAKLASHLTVFQRRPNWCKPLHNRSIDKVEMASIRRRYPDIFKRCKETISCFMHTPDMRHTMQVAEDQREEFWEKLYDTPGFGFWVGNFCDILTDPEANAAVSDFVARKIRGRVKNPKIAELLIPTDHGFGTRRVPQETFYYEVYNQENVELVSIVDNPIERITSNGIEMCDRSFEFDMIIYATGFDAITGSFDRIDIRGSGKESLKTKWHRALETYLGIQVSGFPNMFMVMGPHTALGNIPRSIEYNVEWVTKLICFMREHSCIRVEAREEAVQNWTQFVLEKAEGLLGNEVDSWMTGVNQNVEGKEERLVARFSGSAPAYREHCDLIAEQGYKELSFS